MTIPEVADRLREIAAEVGLPEVAGLADQLRRRPARQRAPRTSEPMTDELASQIRAFKRANPRASQASIGMFFHVNPGRVSEALRGKRA